VPTAVPPHRRVRTDAHRRGHRWSQRYEHIRAFEKLLCDEGTTIVKFFLNVSKEEQRVRLQERVDDPKKRWKFAKADLAERKLWDQYTDAYEEMLHRTSAPHAPWYVVPADRNWFRDLVVLQALIEALDKMGLDYPEPAEGVIGTIVE
jgi:polyphosphate kinase 2 (PPK2 family)